MAKDSKSLIQRLDGIEDVLSQVIPQFGWEGISCHYDLRKTAREIYGIAHGLCPNCGADQEAWEHDFGDAPCCKGAK